MKMKIVTKRHGKAPLLEEVRLLQKMLVQLKGGKLVPLGVYRFKSFEESEKWMLKKMIATHARHNLKTS